jgi:hypothetical protein
LHYKASNEEHSWSSILLLLVVVLVVAECRVLVVAVELLAVIALALLASYQVETHLPNRASVLHRPQPTQSQSVRVALVTTTL